MRLIRCPPGRISGEILYRGRDLLALDEAELADIRGKDIAMIFQNPISSLNPGFVGAQLLEAMTLHPPARRRTLRDRVREIFTRVGHSLGRAPGPGLPPISSGGMCQAP